MGGNTRRHLKLVAPGNLRRVLRVLRSVRWFRGHRYVLWRAALSTVRMLTGRAPGPRVAELSVGNACQLRCGHCYATDVTQQQVPLGQILSSVDALARVGCLSVMLVGGEPTLRHDLLDIVGHIRQQRIVPFLFTNGVRLDRERLVALQQAGLFGILFSVLGDAAEHDRFVGHPGAYAALMSALDHARELGLWVSLNTTPSHQMLADGGFDRLAQLAKAKGVGLKFNYPALLGRWADRWEELLSDDEAAGLRARVARHAHVSNDMFTTYLDNVCPAGHFGLYITDRGEVTPCAYIPVSFGNVGQEPLEVIRERMRTSPVFGQLHRKCLVGEDREFIARYIAPTFGRSGLPIRWHEHPERARLVAQG